MKVRLLFTETVSYETTIDFRPTGELAAKLEAHEEVGDPMDIVVRDILEEPCEDGEPLWFHMLEKQDPGWTRKCIAGVDERNLTAVVITDK